ncbi:MULTISPECIES: AAA family ATPase [Olivibacter]|uniref:AAA family ATPase n=1 Tax=Olivibacter oleidegradans TaxID=760123 RepID=A0ABV6HIG6_9SPHI|nr:AAA family ATPase [Olivibacter jilunii]
MENIKINKLGPIGNADVNFGSLTVLVGPHASGKGILLQLIKLLVDKEQIRQTIEQYGYVWGTDVHSILDRYFGEGMSRILGDDSTIEFDGKDCPLAELLPEVNDKLKPAAETLFYIPAQRVVCLQNGWPRFFTDYEDSVPYVLRHFSETLRHFLESSTGPSGDVIFPQNQRLRTPLRDSFNDSIFHDGKITLDQRVKKRFKLNVSGSSIPYMAWSAGQKEFMPLLLSFYWLCPSSLAGRKEHVKYVIIEEPEMGLHPQAIESVILQVIDLLSRDYKVIISTHSPVLLEFAWAFQYLKKSKAGDSLLAELFNLPLSESVNELFKGILRTKTIQTYYFDRVNDKVDIKDISTLDAGNADPSVAEWGGLSSFSSKASDIISRVMSQEA